MGPLRRPDAKDFGISVCLTLNQIDIQIPSVPCRGKLGINILSLGKKSDSVGMQERRSQVEQKRQWRESPGANDVEGLVMISGEGLDAHRLDLDAQAGQATRLPKKTALLGVALDQNETLLRVVGAEGGDDQRRKTAAASEVEPGSKVGRREREKLHRILDVTLP